MKRFFILAATAATVAMTSCAKNETLPNTNAQNEISFRTAIGKELSRASAIDDDALKTSGFKVTAYTTTGDIGTASVAALPFFVDEVNYTDAWATTQMHYWPVTENGKLSFFGYPKAITLIDPAAGAMPSFSYTVKAVDSQEDLIVAASCNQVKKDPIEAIQMTFKHVLSRLKFSAKAADASYFVKVSKIEILKAANVGTISFTAAGAPTVSDQTGPADYTYSTAETGYIGNTITAIAGANGDLMILPQNADAANFQLAVTYTCYVKLPDDTYQPISAEATKTVQMQSIASGKYYNYQLTLPNNGAKITFTATVSDWPAATDVAQDM